MALRPNASLFIPGTGGSQPSSSSSISNKQSSFVNTSNPPPTPSSSVPQNITINNPSRPPAKTKGFPRGNQGKRGQTQRKSEKNTRLTEEALSVDPIIERVFFFFTSMSHSDYLKGHVWTSKQTRADIIESSLKFYDCA